MVQYGDAGFSLDVEPHPTLQKNKLTYCVTAPAEGVPR